MSKLNFGFIAFILCTSILPMPASAAAPVCARVMMPEISAADISATVTSLAEMKLHIDLLKVDGLDSRELQILNEQFPLKLAELQRALSDRQSEKQVDQIIVDKIQELQKSKDRSKIEREHRSSEQSEFKKTYQLSRRIPLINASFRDGLFKYLPEQNFIIYSQQGNPRHLVRLDLKTGKRKYLQTPTPQNMVLTPDRKNLVTYDYEVGVQLVDIVTGKKKTLLAGGPNRTINNIAIDPLSGVVFAADSNSLYSLNIISGEQKHFTDLGPRWPIVISETKVILTNPNFPHVIFDTVTQSMERLGPAQAGSHVMEIETGKVVALVSKDAIEFYNVNQPATPFHVQPKGDTENSPIFKSKVAGKNLLVADLSSGKFDITPANDRKFPDFGIFSMKDLFDPIFTFDEYSYHDFAFYRANSISFSPDGNSMAVHADRLDAKTNKVKTFIDIWELK